MIRWHDSTHPYELCNVAFAASWKPSHYNDNLFKYIIEMSAQYYTTNNVVLVHEGILQQ